MTVEVDPPSPDSPDGSGEATVQWDAIVERLWGAEPALDSDAWLGLLASQPPFSPNGSPGDSAWERAATIEAPSEANRHGDADPPPFLTVPFRPPPLLNSPLTGVPAPPPPPLLPSPVEEPPLAAASIVPTLAPPPGPPLVDDALRPVPPPAVPGTPPRDRLRAFLHRSTRHHLTLAAVALGVVALVVGFVIFERAGTAAVEHSAQRQLAAEWTRASPTAGPPASLAGLLTAPRLGVHGTVVVEGATLGHLRDGPALETTAARPGQPGAVVILGHHSAYGSPFGRLSTLRLGDEITLRTTAGTFIYKVSRTSQLLGAGGLTTLTLPSPAEVQKAGGKGDHADQDVVLATSAGWSASHLRVVVATLWQSSAVTVETPGASVANVRVQAVAGQPIGVLWAGVWLAVIALALCWAPRSWSRLPPAAAYALASIVVLLAAYQLFLAADRVLPGSI